MRQIVLDTETTGLEPKEGHRVIEIGCVEIIERRLTGKHFHVYINPERKVEEEAFKVHGISDDFLKDKPTFREVIHPFIDFVNGAELIIHNAPFDVGFLNHEFKLFDKSLDNIDSMCSVIDTLVMAREKHPKQKNNLDALCRRYDIDNSKRELHGALLDAEILAFVYLAMTGGQEELFQSGASNENKVHYIEQHEEIKRSKSLPVIMANDEELELHKQFLDLLDKKSGAESVWRTLDSSTKH